MSSFVILTGASGSGKTTLARAIQRTGPPRCEVLFFDSVGVPSAQEMLAYGDGHHPGGAWQRATTIQWMKRIAEILQAGTSVLFEGQMRIAFIREALAIACIKDAHILLIDCDDATRAARLNVNRNQPELATLDMLTWSRYLRDEANQMGCEISTPEQSLSNNAEIASCNCLLANQLYPCGTCSNSRRHVFWFFR